MAFRTSNTLNLAVCAALNARRADILRYLLISHGPAPFALAIAARPSRQVADLMSLLAPAQRTAVFRYLPKELRARLVQTGMPFFDPSACTRQNSIVSRAGAWLLPKTPRSWASASSMNSQNTRAPA